MSTVSYPVALPVESANYLISAITGGTLKNNINLACFHAWNLQGFLMGVFIPADAGVVGDGLPTNEEEQKLIELGEALRKEECESFIFSKMAEVADGMVDGPNVVGAESTIDPAIIALILQVVTMLMDYWKNRNKS